MGRERKEEIKVCRRKGMIKKKRKGNGMKKKNRMEENSKEN